MSGTTCRRALDKADCVVVFHSVVKARFHLAEADGRGAMTCGRVKLQGGQNGVSYHD